MTVNKLSSFSLGSTEVVFKEVLDSTDSTNFIITEFAGHDILKNNTFSTFASAGLYYEDLVKLYLNNFFYSNYEKGYGTQTYCSVCTK